MSDPLFGELYLRSTRPFLSEIVSDAEGRFLAANLPPGRLLDLGCGHGRHLARVKAVGVDGDALSLNEAKHHGPVVRADFRALPFRTAAFDGAWCWYNTLGTAEDESVPLILKEVARCIAPKGLLIIQGTHLDYAAAQPPSSFEGALPDGSFLKENAVFEPAKRRDLVYRHLISPDGRKLETHFFIRYYALDEWRGLLAEAGLEVQWGVGGLDGAPLESTSPDLIVGATRKVENP